ncbi:uncharacterized protein LOC117317104 [Pecten maximus]|uniref:uncharacterized protein LOC117317104 n=1 Tax=Pecten maximus TaxID=6579 RepID=UPI001458E535|nr:uncharacterized protein LOC117317104 [Pecten maximus]
MLRILLSIIVILTYGLSRGLECNNTRTNICMDVADFCLNGGTCHYDTSSCQYQCRCTRLFTGRRCGERKNFIQSERDIYKSPTGIDRSPREISRKTLSPSPTEDYVCSPNYKIRPLDERDCTIGFACMYGYCNIENFSFDCSCDIGGVGPLCENKCCLQCSEHGRCELENGIEFCHCATNYEGRLCEISTISTTLPTGTLSSTMTNVSSPSEKTTTASEKTSPLSGKTTSPNEITSSLSGKTTSSSENTSSPNENTSQSENTTPPSEEPKPPMITATPSDASTKTLLTKHAASANDTTTHYVCSPNYIMRPLEERDCSIFICKYGYCNFGNFSFDCSCDIGGVGQLCEDKCCMQCSEHGRCELEENGSEFCHCETNYEGRLCDRMLIIPSQASPEQEDLVALWTSVAVVLIGLILAGVLMFFWMWRNRVTIIMKIVHYFQAYEDDDEKTWDSFISYKSSDVDQHFVLHVLLPKLEELGFKVCLHCRDFLPGETIANNIINAIVNSRRTILILSPRFVRSEFTRLEYQVAQQEMLKRKHRIIPLLLEDISADTVDPNLKQILRCVTYLEYPGADSSEKNMNRFWKKLSLAMPKKRIIGANQKRQNDVVIDVKDEENVEVRTDYAKEDNKPTHIMDVTTL